MEKDEKEAKALFRYGLISEFLHCVYSRGIQNQGCKKLHSSIIKFRGRITLTKCQLPHFVDGWPNTGVMDIQD